MNLYRRVKPRVTRAMIIAGLKVLHESGAVERQMGGADELLIEEIYAAMSKVPNEV